jgi:hypothetical protein
MSDNADFTLVFTRAGGLTTITVASADLAKVVAAYEDFLSRNKIPYTRVDKNDTGN